MRASEQFRIYTNSPIKYLVDFFIKNTLKDLPYKEIRKFVKEIKTGKTPPKKVFTYWDKAEYNWFRPEDIGRSIYLDNSSKRISSLAVEQNKATIYKKDTLLITGIGDLGRLGLLKKESSSNQQITGILFSDKVIPEFAYFYFLSMKNQFDEKSSKTTLPILNQKTLSSIKIKIPEIGLQREFNKFMNYCWACFENKKLPENFKFNLDPNLLQFAKKIFLIYYSKNNLESNSSSDKILLQKLRQSILQEAVQGKKFNKHTLGDLLEFTKNGFTGRPNDLGKGLIRLGIETVTQSRFISIHLEKAKYMEIPEEKRGNYHVKNNDLFVCRQNGNLNFVGKAAVYSGEDDKVIFSDSLIQLRPKINLVDSKFLAIFLNSSIAREQLDEFCSTTAGNFSINGTNLKKTVIPLPPLPEQKRIVEKVDVLMKLCDELEERINENKKSSEVLMSAVLKESFGN